MKFAYGVLASKAIINQKTEQLSVIDIIDQIQVDNLPVAMPSVSLVAFWIRGDGEEGDVELVVRMKRDPELPQELVQATNYVSPQFVQIVPAVATSARAILEANAILIAHEGINKFVFEQKVNNRWQDAGHISVNVQLNAGPMSVATSPASVPN